MNISWISCWLLQCGPRPIKYLLCFVLHKTQLLHTSSRCMNQSVVRSRYKGNKCTDCIIKPSNAFSIFLWIIHDRTNKKPKCTYSSYMSTLFLITIFIKCFDCLYIFYSVVIFVYFDNNLPYESDKILCSHHLIYRVQER